MRQLIVLFHKEYRETRSESLVFLAIGALVAILLGLQDLNAFGDSFRFRNMGGDVAFGGLVALWLNLTVLCATAFAREKEGRAMDALRRLAPNWRVAALGKFGYAFLSTLVIGVLVFSATLAIDYYTNQPLLSAASSCFDSENRYVLGQAGLTFNLLQTFTWGVFWTGRLSRQTSAILLSVVSAILCGCALSFVLQIFGLWENELYMRLAVLASGVLILIFAPGKNQFGYKYESVARPHPFNVKNESSRDSDAIAKEWSDAQKIRPRGSFITLFETQLSESALLFPSPSSIFYELALLLGICATVALGEIGKAGTVAELKMRAVFFSLYFLCFASGLFCATKDDRALVKERFDVEPRKYWLAGFTASILCFLTLGATWGISSAFSNCFQLIPIEDKFQMLNLALIALGIGTWTGTLRASRLVRGAVSMLLTISSLFLPKALKTIISLWNDDFSNSVGLMSQTPELIFTTIIMFTFIAGSYRRATRSMNYRDSKGAFVVPLLILFTPLVWGTYVGNYYSKPIDRNALIYAPKRESFDPSLLPSTKDEYLRRAREAKEQVGSQERFKLIDRNTFYLANETIDNPIGPTNIVEDSLNKLIKAYELTKRRAAPFRAAAIAEERFYNALLDEKLSQEEANKALEFLQEIPERRPTPEELADSEYLAALYDSLDASGLNFETSNYLLSTRKKYWEIYCKAAENVCQIQPYFVKQIYGESDKPIDDELGRYIEFSYESNNEFYQTTCALFECVTKEIEELERTRRFLLLIIAERAYGKQTIEPTQLIESASLSKIPQLLSKEMPDPFFTCEIYTPYFRSIAPKNLVGSFNDEDGNPLKTPDGREVYQSNSPNYLNVFAPDPQNPNKSVKLSVFDVSQAAYDKNGEPLVSIQNETFLAVKYHFLTENGTPQTLVEYPCDVDPPFDCDNAIVLREFHRPGNPQKKPTISRVVAFNPCVQEYQSAALLKGVWKVEEFYGREFDKSQSMKERETINEQATEQAKETQVSKNQTFEQKMYKDGHAPRTRYLDDNGKEIVDANDNPQYFLRQGVFACPDGRAIKEYVNAGYRYAFKLPENIASRSDRLLVLYQSKVGRYQPLPEQLYKVGGGCVFFNMPGVVAGAYRRLDELGANIEQDKRDYPVLVVDFPQRLNISGLR